MKKTAAAVLAAALALAGCTSLHSTTTRVTDPKTGVVTETTDANVSTFMDGNANVTKFSNRSGYVGNGTNWAPGTYVTGLSEQSSSSNLVLIISGVSGAVVQGAVSGLK